MNDVQDAPNGKCRRYQKKTSKMIPGTISLRWCLDDAIGVEILSGCVKASGSLLVYFASPGTHATRLAQSCQQAAREGRCQLDHRMTNITSLTELSILLMLSMMFKAKHKAKHKATTAPSLLSITTVRVKNLIELPSGCTFIPMAPQQAAQVVAVTGVSGYIGSEVVKQLLEKGYTVRGTVRSKSNTSKVQHLLTLSDALPGHLELFEADLLKAGDFDDVVKGADFVLHTASPFFTDTSDPQKDLVDPAVNGTTNVLNAAGKAGIKRVVITSSVAGKLLRILPCAA